MSANTPSQSAPVETETETKTEQRTHRLVPVVATLSGVVAAVASVRLGVGELSEPGPGAWPLIASLGVVGTGAWLTVTGVERPERSDPGDLARVVAAIAGVAAFIVLLPLIGMPVPAALVVLAWMRLFGEPWRMSLLVAVLGVIVLQIVFVNLLAVPLPVGPLAPGR